MNHHEKINYIEFPARDLAGTKAFFAAAFGWTFIDYGEQYTAFSGAGLEGGFFQSELAASTERGSALVVLFSDSLEETLAKIESLGGKIVQPIMSFPGGRRFHFTEPSGNELSVWSDRDVAGEPIA